MVISLGNILSQIQNPDQSSIYCGLGKFFLINSESIYIRLNIFKIIIFLEFLEL